VFTRRQINIESLNVSASSIKGVHKYTITVWTTQDVIEKVVKQIEKKIDVLQAHYFTDSEIYQHEIALYKVSTPEFQENPMASKVIRRYSARIVEVNPFNEKAYLLKGEMLMEQKEFDQAIEFYTEAIELMPQNAVLYQERGRIRLLKGDKEGSIEDMKKAIELNPDNEKLNTGNYDNLKQNSAPGIY
jgi:acetolactate synthase small subunit